MELSKSKLQLFSSLSSAKMRRKHRLFIVEGEKGVADCLASYLPSALVVLKGADVSLPPCQAPVMEASEQEMRKISNLTTPPTLIGVFHLPEEEERMEPLDPDRLYLMLDGVQDPGNLGTIIRTCHWFGVFTIIASRDTVDVFNPKVVQATMGSLGHVRVVYADLARVIGENPAMPVYGTLLEGENIFHADLSVGGLIIMGNEGNGISAPIRQLITRPLNIPPATPDHGESLNVAIATAITLSQFRAR